MTASTVKIRTRFAPSPTGPLHLGNARSALFSFIFSRQNSGQFILRIEDTDLERSDPVFEKDILEGLKWLGINWDEFYRQSERLDIYEKYLKFLLAKKVIFWCPHSEKELALERQAKMAKKEPPVHICPHRDETLVQDPKNILRFRNDAGENIVFDDLIRGRINFSPKILGDFSVAKNLRSPLYNFAVAVDDSETKISHVIRGEDHISNTPKQILIQEALGFQRPFYAHLPMILGQDRSKLSKRHGAASLLEYRKLGYLAEAVLNFLILLGWHPKDEKEIFTMEEILKEFILDRVQKGGAVFNIDKLNWLNREYIKKLDAPDLSSRLEEYAGKWTRQIKNDPEKWLKIAALMRERLTTLAQAGENMAYFYEEPYFSKELLFWKEEQNAENILRHLTYFYSLFEKFDEKEWIKEKFSKEVMAYADKEGRGWTLWPLRAALSGRKTSPDPIDIAEILGKKETLSRLKKAISLFS
ncbi:MAG: glutamate--tRNA ligase [Patescibacteria group bacterium]